jgi:hypothetical protein
MKKTKPTLSAFILLDRSGSMAGTKGIDTSAVKDDLSKI